MNRRTAKTIHGLTNIAYWFENPDWDAGSPLSNFVCRCVQSLPFSMHEIQKRAFYDTNKVLAVQGETVVAANGTDKVDKFMFRVPGKMALETFKNRVEHEVGAVTRCLAGVALPTQVTIKSAYVFRRPQTYLPAVTQTQKRLDLDIHAPIDMPTLAEAAPSPPWDRTARDLETLLRGTEVLVTDYDYYPDIGNNSGNLRRSVVDGSVTLIDVMPFYTNGSRLIGDHPPHIVSHILDNIQNYQEFVGRYGG